MTNEKKYKKNNKKPHPVQTEEYENYFTIKWVVKNI